MFVHTIEQRQGLKIACLEEIGFNNGWISKKEISEASDKLLKNSYGKYLKNISGLK
jgi:glucose-1-phosphate thymidylyltransferase